MTKGQLMQLVYTKDELPNIDTAIPISMWSKVDTSIHVMNYNDSSLGALENMLDIAKERGIKINN